MLQNCVVWEHGDHSRAILGNITDRRKCLQIRWVRRRKLFDVLCVHIKEGNIVTSSNQVLGYRLAHLANANQTDIFQERCRLTEHRRSRDPDKEEEGERKVEFGRGVVRKYLL
jgi:hypothetical protein